MSDYLDEITAPIDHDDRPQAERTLGLVVPERVQNEIELALWGRCQREIKKASCDGVQFEEQDEDGQIVVSGLSVEAIELRTAIEMKWAPYIGAARELGDTKSPAWSDPSNTELIQSLKKLGSLI